MRLIDADALKEKLDELDVYIDCDKNLTTWILSDEVYNTIDNAPSVEGPKYILKVKNLTAEDKKRFQEEWNKSAGGLLAISDNYEIVPIERPQGEWKIGGRTTHYYYCSICGKDGDFQDNFCRSCGADMRKGGAV